MPVRSGMALKLARTQQLRASPLLKISLLTHGDRDDSDEDDDGTMG